MGATRIECPGSVCLINVRRWVQALIDVSSPYRIRSDASEREPVLLIHDEPSE
jgi:hypothetical protein